jgi:uncharacterized protein
LNTVYITSIKRNSGKTMFGAVLAKQWAGSGKKVGYIKFILSDQPADKNDSLFMQQVLPLKEVPETIIQAVDNSGKITEKARTAITSTSQGKDILIIEGMTVPASVLAAINARALVVHDYADPLTEAIPGYKKIGERLLGVVLNKVLRKKVEGARKEALDELSRNKITLLGVVPEDRVLAALTVAELAELIGGKILNNADKSSELVENLMVGAMSIDSGLDYFGRKNNKAVLLKGDRPDMQLAALQTSTRCLVLVGKTAPIPVVRYEAQVKKVPLIQVDKNIASLITAIENASGGIRFRQEKKLVRAGEVLGQSLDIKMLQQKLDSADSDNIRTTSG